MSTSASSSHASIARSSPESEAHDTPAAPLTRNPNAKMMRPTGEGLTLTPKLLRLAATITESLAARLLVRAALNASENALVQTFWFALVIAGRLFGEIHGSTRPVREGGIERLRQQSLGHDLLPGTCVSALN